MEGPGLLLGPAPLLESSEEGGQMDEFKDGDLVQLKSGGPTMTVGHCSVEDLSQKVSVPCDKMVSCCWFQKINSTAKWELFGASFKVSALRKA